MKSHANGPVEIAVYQLKPGQKLAEVVGAGWRRKTLVGVGRDQKRDDGSRLEQCSAVLQAQSGYESKGAAPPKFGRSHLRWTHPVVDVGDFHFLQQEMHAHRSPSLDVVKFVHAVLPAAN